MRTLLGLCVALALGAAAAPAQDAEITRKSDQAARKLSESNQVRAADPAAADRLCDEAVILCEEVLAALPAATLNAEDRADLTRTALYNMACARSLQGKKEEALGLLERAMKAGYADYAHMQADGDLAPIRGEARFGQLIEESKQRTAARRAAFKTLEEEERKAKALMVETARLIAEKKQAEADAKFAEARRVYEALFAKVPGFELKQAAKLSFYASAFYNMACAHSLSGRTDQALEAFERAITAGFEPLFHVQKDTDLDPIREQPRFKEVMTLAKEAQAIARVYAGHLARQKALFPFELSVETLEGKKLTLADLRGKIVIVNVFSTSTRPWEVEPRNLQAMQRMFADRLQVVGLAVEEGGTGADVAAKVEAALTEAGVTYPVALSTKEALAGVPDLATYPSTLFIDKAGRVRFMGNGPIQAPVVWILARLLDMEDD